MWIRDLWSPIAKQQGLDVNVTVAVTMTLTASITTDSCLLSTHYLPGTVIDALHKLGLLLMRNLQVGIINLLIS